MTLSPLTADIIGICGSVLFIIGFAYANLAKAMDQLLFNALNLGGAILLLISLSVHFNLAAVVLEVAWGAIALAGLVRAIWGRSRSKADVPNPLMSSEVETASGKSDGVSTSLDMDGKGKPTASGNGVAAP